VRNTIKFAAVAAVATWATVGLSSAMHPHAQGEDAAHSHDAGGKAVALTVDQAGFERLKSLAGDWTAKTEHGEHKGEAKVNYRVTAGGSVVMETLFGGTPGEMITMYYLDGGKLVLTHYCMLHNQPHMTLGAGSTADALQFACDASASGDNLASEKEPHMHAAAIRFVDADHVQTQWTMWTGGKADGSPATFDLRRVKN
jgi:hypothetical protein